MKEQKNQTPVAVTENEFLDYGCPKCGSIFGYYPYIGGGEGIWICADCGTITTVFSVGITETSSSINGIIPQLVEHPRKSLGKIDREAIVEKRAKSIEESQFAEFKKWIDFGYGNPTKVRTVSHHSSKSQNLPIVAAKGADSNVEVVWFGDNFHSHFLGMKFNEPVCASFLYPISGCLNELACSSHVNETVAAELPHYVRASYNREMIKTLGVECDGISAALIIRYLHEISKLDYENILRICYNENREGGKKTFIHGNHVEFESLIRAVDPGLKQESYGAFFNLPEDSIFEKIYINEFSDITRNGASVVVTIKAGSLLPALPFPFNRIFANPSETVLGEYLPEAIQQRKLPDTYDNYVITAVPVNLLHYQEELMKEPDWNEYNLHEAHCRLNKGFKTLIFDTNNLLDAVMTGIFLAKAVDPVAKLYFKK
ncbi:MAG: hypothetical protein WC719_02160 [Patescibacteria group bacterium]|jgi:hypothetical protein